MRPIFILSRTMSAEVPICIAETHIDEVLTCEFCHVRETAEGMGDIAILASAVPPDIVKIRNLGRIGYFGRASLSLRRHCYS